MVADKSDLHSGGAEEEESANDGDGERGSVKTAGESEVDGVGHILAGASTETVVAEPIVSASWSVADRSLHHAFARVGTIASENGNCDESSGEKDVENKSQEGEERDASEAACKDDCANGVDYGGAGDALNCLLPCWDVDVTVGEDREKLEILSVNGFRATQEQAMDSRSCRRPKSHQRRGRLGSKGKSGRAFGSRP